MIAKHAMLNYLDCSARVAEVYSTLEKASRVVDNHELALLRPADATRNGLVSDALDWQVMATRLAEYSNIFLRGFDVCHVLGDQSARSAVFGAVFRQGRPRLSRINADDLAQDLGLDTQRVRTILLNMLDPDFAASPKLLGEHAWASKDEIVFKDHVTPAVSIVAELASESYPAIPLRGLYTRVDSKTAGGMSGRVGKHSVNKTLTWAKRGDAVAIKLIPADRLRSAHGGDLARGEERLLREFLVGAQAKSDRFARAYDLFRVDLPQPLEGRGTYPHYGLVMEWLDGLDLSKPRGSLLTRWQMAAELCEAVAEFHKNGWIHRDIKPANAVVSSRGLVLIDFGGAKSLDDDENLTRKHDGLFTERYASPEVYAGDEAQVADDVYSMGISIYEIISKKRAYDGLSVSEIRRSKVLREAPVLKSLLPVSAGLDAVIRQSTGAPETRPKAEDVHRWLRANVPLGVGDGTD